MDQEAAAAMHAEEAATAQRRFDEAARRTAEDALNPQGARQGVAQLANPQTGTFEPPDPNAVPAYDETPPSETPEPTVEPPEAIDPAKQREAEERAEAYQKSVKDRAAADLEAEKERARLDEERNKIPQFDPVAEAEKRRDKERKRAQIDAAYKEKYGGGDEESGLDQFLKIADSLRGTLGGVFGTVAGAVLDVVSGVRKSQVESAKEKRDQDLLAEAKQTTQAVDVLAQPTRPAKEVKAAPDPSLPDVPTDLIPSSAPLPRPSAPAKPPASKQPPAPATKAPPLAAGAAKGAGAAPPAAAAGAAGEAGAAAGAGGAAGGAMAGMAAAAGPIGIAIVAAKAVIDATVGAVKSVIGGVGNALAEVASASADPAAPIAKMGDAASSAGEKLAYLSPAIGIATVAFGESAKALAVVMQALDKTAERYGEFSPDIAMAQAVSEVRHTMGDFRRAQEVGATMAEYVMARSDLQQKIEDIKVKALTAIIPMVTRILEVIEMALSAGEGAVDVLSAAMEPLNDMARGISEIAGYFVGKKSDREVEDPTALIFDPRFTTAGGGTPTDPGLAPRL